MRNIKFEIKENHIVFDGDYMVSHSAIGDSIKDLEIQIEEDTAWLVAMKEAKYQLNFVGLEDDD